MRHNPHKNKESYIGRSKFATTKSFSASSNQQEKNLQIRILSPNAKLPSRATLKSTGYDLCASNKCVIPGNNNELVSIGLAMIPPKGCYIIIAPRSRLDINHKLQIGAGVIDPDYTGASNTATQITLNLRVLFNETLAWTEVDCSSLLPIAEQCNLHRKSVSISV